MASQDLWEPLSRALPPLPSSEEEDFPTLRPHDAVSLSGSDPLRGSKSPRHFKPALTIAARPRSLRRKKRTTPCTTFVPHGSDVEVRLRRLVRPATNLFARSELEGSPVSPSVVRKKDLFPALAPPPALAPLSIQPRYCDRPPLSASSQRCFEAIDWPGCLQRGNNDANRTDSGESVGPAQPYEEHDHDDASMDLSFDLPFLSQDLGSCDTFDILLQHDNLSQGENPLL
jgi:hypothetical protein